MPETKSATGSVPPPPPATPSAGTPAGTGQTQYVPPPSTIKAPAAEAGKDAMAASRPSLDIEKKPAGAHPPPVQKTGLPKSTWIMLFILLLLLLIFLFIVTGSRKETVQKKPLESQSAEQTAELSNYSAYVAKSKTQNEIKYSEQTLTDEAFAGQAPLTVRAAGPLISPEIDPQLAALADALRIRLRIAQGSQSIVRGSSVVRISKGDFRGFKINSMEKLENGVRIADEITVGTPRNGSLKTVNQVLELVQKTDFALFVSELRNAGLEFLPLPELPGKKIFRGQLRSERPWGKSIPGELLISGKSVGGIILGMPVAQIRSALPTSYGVLKRKVLVNDAYVEIYKVTDQANETLFYLYEKEGRVWGISVISGIFKTERGIGIGSSLDLVRTNYSSVRLAYSEKKTPFIQLEGVDGIFIIQNSGDKNIISILVGESPEFE